MSRLARVLMAVAFLGALWPLSILSAGAQIQTTPAPGGHFCNVTVVPDTMPITPAEAQENRDIESRGFTVKRWQPGPMDCYATMQDLQAAHPSPQSTDPAASPQSSSNTPATTLSSVTADLYDLVNYDTSGDWIQFTFPNDCSGGVVQSLSYVSDYMNDKTSSAQIFGGCSLIQFFTNANWTGNAFSCPSYCYSVNAWASGYDNTASSFKLWP